MVENWNGATATHPTFVTFLEHFTYDNANRLTYGQESNVTSATGPFPVDWSRNFNYDPYGNMWVTDPTGITPPGNTPSAQSNFQASNNQLATSRASFDAAGNQLAVNDYQVTYDGENRQTSVTSGSTSLGTYTYDGNGNRATRTTASGTTLYVYDALGQLAAEYSTAASTSALCQTCYLHRDHLGTVRLVTDASGNIMARDDYLAFGEEIPSGVPAGSTGRGDPTWDAADNINRKFTGKERDPESGLDYFARYYGSGLGRFTSADDGSDQDPADPQSWNLYSYVRNNPLSNVDPNGEDCITTSDQNSSGVEVTTERGGSAETCSGTYVNGTVDTNSYQYNGRGLGYSFANESASGAGTIQFGQNQNDDALSPDVANMLNQAGVMAAPLVNLSGEGLKLGASIAFPFTSLLANAAIGSDSNSARLAGLSRKPGNLGQFKGADALRRENKIARDIIKQLNLQGKQAQQVHDIIQGASIDAGEQLGFTELLEIVKTTLGLL